MHGSPKLQHTSVTSAYRDHSTRLGQAPRHVETQALARPGDNSHLALQRVSYCSAHRIMYAAYAFSTNWGISELRSYVPLEIEYK